MSILIDFIWNRDRHKILSMYIPNWLMFIVMNMYLINQSNAFDEYAWYGGYFEYIIFFLIFYYILWKLFEYPSYIQAAKRMSWSKTIYMVIDLITSFASLYFMGYLGYLQWEHVEKYGSGKGTRLNRL